ncbi:hypothetical protein IEU95_01815 [Hoyosella rhizosphaerae]|uniref:Uncharacterized protein n=1 Tax=Hoyosella rhizosphaerae TaxID=1755582 RepID=A0A916XFL4_9ACTN|nr:hypothetical protein [Hoyosella rhizosphaerae]MBN4925552.1 hypothetical protein [Hoyosella rhizosphaerae]GGC69767.1 hypothetical protein GCM10011410_23240 [Hoyosella rhizosphaerae]
MTTRLIEHAQTASEAIRAIAHDTPDVPSAPELYDVLADLKYVPHRLPDALTKFRQALVRSLDELDVFDDARDPQDSVSRCNAHLVTAAELLATAGEHLEKAQAALSAQGYRS